jgi:hypothetical protein
MRQTSERKSGEHYRAKRHFSLVIFYFELNILSETLELTMTYFC